MNVSFAKCCSIFLLYLGKLRFAVLETKLSDYYTKPVKLLNIAISRVLLSKFSLKS